MSRVQGPESMTQDSESEGFLCPVLSCPVLSSSVLTPHSTRTITITIMPTLHPLPSTLHNLPSILSPIELPSKIKMQLQHASLKYTSKPCHLLHLPLLIQNLKSNIFIWRSCMKAKYGEFFLLRSFQEILRSLRLVNQIRVEYSKFITLYFLRRWIVEVVMRLIISVPIPTGPHPVEVPGLAGSVLVLPPVRYAWEGDLLLWLHLSKEEGEGEGEEG